MVPGDTVLGLSHTRQQGLRIRDSLALMNKTHEVCSFQNGFSNKNRTGMRVCDAIFNHRRKEVGAGDEGLRRQYRAKGPHGEGILH